MLFWYSLYLIVAIIPYRSIIRVDSVREHIDNYIRQDIPPSVEKPKGSKDRASNKEYRYGVKKPTPTKRVVS